MFFEHQMPQIIKSLQSLSEALNRKNPVVKLPLAEGSDILKELYLGNYEASVFNNAAPPAAQHHSRFEMPPVAKPMTIRTFVIPIV